MNILWVPHTSWQTGTRARASYFIERLAKHHAIHVLCWDVPIRRSLSGLVSAVSVWRRFDGRLTYHHVPRLPSRLDVRRDGAPVLTEAIFQWMVHRIVRAYGIDVVVCACNWYALGFPPRNLSVPLVLDYFDILSDVHEAQYFAIGDAVLCASPVMYDRARQFSLPAFYLPNGIDTELFRAADGAPVRRQYGLDGNRLVSLIGLTASPTLYFLDAIDLVAREYPDVKGLIVGGGGLQSAIEEAVKGREDGFHLVGSVDYEYIPAFFAASDVGLYPGEKAPQFDAALPIKVLEYSAAGKPVVVPPLEGLLRLNLPNLIFAEPTAEGFAAGIKQALRQPVPTPDLAPFEISTLASELSAILERLVASHPVSLAGTARGEIPA